MRGPAPGARALWGAIAVVVYLATAALSYRAGLLPVRPLYQGTAPPTEYRWVTPPPDLAGTNLPPEPGTGTIALNEKGSVAGSVSTPDGQVILSFPDEAFEPRREEEEIEVQVEPHDPAGLGPPPAGLLYDGNAYLVTATYARSGERASTAARSCPDDVRRRCPTVVLRYAFGATAMFRRDGESWTRIEATPVPASLSIFAEVPTLGTFVAGHRPAAAGTPVRTYAAVLTATAAAAAALGFSRRSAVRRWWRRRRKRSARKAGGGKPRRRR